AFFVARYGTGLASAFDHHAVGRVAKGECLLELLALERSQSFEIIVFEERRSPALLANRNGDKVHVALPFERPHVLSGRVAVAAFRVVEENEEPPVLKVARLTLDDDRIRRLHAIVLAVGHAKARGDKYGCGAQNHRRDAL